MTKLPSLLLAGLLLAGCEGGAKLRETLYRSGAEIGNRYCETRDETLRDSAVARINRGLRGEGARFDFAGVACDAPADDLES